jgi:soluble lytic murein transglycosylase-like protein
MPKVAAVTFLFLGLSTNTHLDAASTWSIHAGQSTLPAVPDKYNAPEMNAVLSDNGENDFTHVLTAKDAELYRAAFVAQEKADWKTADDILGLIKDKKLMGHILADRYLRRGPTLSEAQQWLSAYNDSPEADALYARAKSLARSAKVTLPRPVVALSWSKSSASEMSADFHVSGDNDNTREKIHTVAKINAALREGDPIVAREFLITETQRHALPTRDQDELAAHIAAAFFYQGEIERARPMAHQAAMAGIPLGLWIDGLSSWKQHDYVFAARSFAALAQAPGLSSWDRTTAAYWAYRATKHTNDDVQARHWLAEAAKDPRSFYGALAASMTTNHSDRSWKMPELTTHDIALLSQKSAGWQALALIQVGKNDLAESELRRLNLSNHDLQIATLALVEKAHMPSLTIQLSGVAINDNGQPYEAAQYPLPPWQPVDGFKVDRALIYALIKHESRFDPAAVSQSGACGLMQIMPNTAHLISNDNQNGKHCPNGLFDPATNMTMGQKYVRVLAGQPMIGDNLLLLLAAYNGGPGNLVHWLDGDDRRDPLLFVESLPMRETRDYVQQVLLQYWMYRSRLSEPETTAAQLARGEWPRYALRDTKTQQAQGQNVELASADQRRSGTTH